MANFITNESIELLTKFLSYTKYEISFSVNGISFGIKTVVNNEAVCEIHFKKGMNTIEAAGSAGGKEIRDVAMINYKFQPFQF